MLSLNELNHMEDSLRDEYQIRLRKYISQININPSITIKAANLMATADSLKINEFPVADSIFDYDAYFAHFDKWVQAEIAGQALESARGIVQNLSMQQNQLYAYKKTLNRYDMEVHRKFTLSFAVLVFFFIGAPLGAIIRKGGLGMPVIVSILLFIFYYIISISGEKSAREDVWSMINGMWFSTYLFLPVGIWLTYKAATDAAIMSAETYTKLLSKLGLGRFLNKKKEEK